MIDVANPSSTTAISMGMPLRPAESEERVLAGVALHQYLKNSGERPLLNPATKELEAVSVQPRTKGGIKALWDRFEAGEWKGWVDARNPLKKPLQDRIDRIFARLKPYLPKSDPTSCPVNERNCLDRINIWLDQSNG